MGASGASGSAAPPGTRRLEGALVGTPPARPSVEVGSPGNRTMAGASAPGGGGRRSVGGPAQGPEGPSEPAAARLALALARSRRTSSERAPFGTRRKYSPNPSIARRQSPRS